MLNLELSGKAAIVTGGSSGIGLATAKALFAEGASVLIAAHRLEDSVTSIKKASPGRKRGNDVVAVDIDLTEADSAKSVAKAAMDHFGKIDILVNCAGAARAGAFLELSDQNFLDAWSLKLLGYIRMVREVVPFMMQRKDGRIVNIIGSSGREPMPTFLCGSTANAALINFTRCVSRELAQHHVRINGISPGPAETEHFVRIAENTAKARGTTTEAIMAETTDNIPIGRMVKPEEIATLVLFLVSDLSAAITGTEILIDGGQKKGI
jgi:NAD(P)-dependent dehydrogenase (short-subunit alcohol dehydrogenase family)